MTKSKNSINYPPLFASAKYYSKEDFQFPVTAVSKIVTSQTVLKKNSGITLLYFRDSNGKIVVNTREYPVSRGTLMCLGAYHYFQFLPEDEPMKVEQCRFSYDTFLYMAANPYYHFSELTLTTEPLTAHLTGELRDRTEKVVDALVETSARHRQKGGMTEFLLSMRLMGFLQKTFFRKPEKY